jgi:geranylgeranyl pyrophosphate synthase
VSGGEPALDGYLSTLRAAIDAALDRFTVPSAPPVIAEPVRYALLGPGKRLRPCLTLAAAERVGAGRGLSPAAAHTCAMPAACAVEMIHTYSLVHDDLPAMDNDALRRGRPTTHVVYGDGMAILAGDGLLTEAFAVVAAAGAPSGSLTAEAWSARCLQAIAVLARAAGMAGMVGGQAIDLAHAGETAVFDRASLEDMHRRKTGALIRAAVTLGGVMTGATEATLRALDVYAAELGLAFQIVDDILDVEGSAAALGKTAGKDAAAGKPTFPAVYGLDTSRQLAAACVARAKAALADASLEGRLGEIADWSLARRQ